MPKKKAKRRDNEDNAPLSPPELIVITQPAAGIRTSGRRIA